MRKKRILFILLIPVLLRSQTGSEPDVLKSLKYLEGIWEGKGEGKSGTSTVIQEYNFIMKDTYLYMKTKAEFKPQEKNPSGEVHEDWGFFSYDQSRKKIVLRQFIRSSS